VIAFRTPFYGATSTIDRVSASARQDSDGDVELRDACGPLATFEHLPAILGRIRGFDVGTSDFFFGQDEASAKGVNFDLTLGNNVAPGL